RGVKESATVNSIIVFVKVAIILLVIATGLAFIRGANYTPFIPPNTGVFGEFGWSGVVRGAAVIFFAYIGFDAVSTAAQEARDPQRDMPRGILGSLVVCTSSDIARMMPAHALPAAASRAASMATAIGAGPPSPGYRTRPTITAETAM